ncbi:hypothetical protein P3T73_00235 [Kiritimatiellota bacterium B12222]|nr:hypothetical protein P3T73_00235 [Kiritimatiellota bacterium B12222]
MKGTDIILALLLVITVILRIKRHALAMPLAGTLAFLTVVRVIWVLFFQGPGIQPALQEALTEHELIGSAFAQTISEQSQQTSRILMLRGPNSVVSQARIQGFKQGWHNTKLQIRELEVPLQNGRIAWDWTTLLEESDWGEKEILVSWVGLPPPPEKPTGNTPRFYSYSMDPEWVWRPWRGRVDFGGAMIPASAQSETEFIHTGYKWIQ